MAGNLNRIFCTKGVFNTQQKLTNKILGTGTKKTISVGFLLPHVSENELKMSVCSKSKFVLENLPLSLKNRNRHWDF